MSTPSNKTPRMERVRIEAGDRTSAFFWRQDLDLLRALYRGSPGGYSTHIRAAVHVMCNQLRTHLAQTPQGRDLLHRLGQQPPDERTPQ